MADIAGIAGTGRSTSVTSTPNTSGGLSSGSVYNMGKTKNSVQKAASSGIENAVVKETLLATSYAKIPDKVPTNVRMADWYRFGRPDPSGEKLFIRPPRSINPSFDEETAAIRVFGTDPNTKKGSVELVPPYTKFILEGTNEGHAERSQIVETFGAFYVFMFGERPPMYTFSGKLINTKDINWRQDFQFYYDNYLRGTKCAERNAHIALTYGGRQIEGLMLNFQTTTDAALEAGVSVSFQVVVFERMATLNLSEDFRTFTTGSGETTDSTFNAMLDQIAGAQGAGLAQPSASLAFQETKKAIDGGEPCSGVLQGVSGSMIG